MRTNAIINSTRVLGLFAICAGLLLSCTKDFSELNTNPNEPVDVPPALLLRQVIYSYADGMSYEGFTGGANLGQYFSADPGFNAFDRGNLLAPQFGGNPWPLLYTNLRDIEIVLEKSREQPTLAVYEGPALVMKSIIAGTITDIFGDAPYFEAVRGREGEVEPAYDLQETIYLGAEGLLANLSLAVEVMDAYSGTATLDGDELYQGDLEKWALLANSLRLKYLLRSGEALDANRLNAMQEIYDSRRFVSDQNTDAVFAFGAAPNDFRFARARLGDFTNYLMSETIDSTLDALGDPREQLWFREASGGGYQGVRNGLPSDFVLDGSSVSLPGRIWREESSNLKFAYMTGWETHFILAEAAARGYIDENPSPLFQLAAQLAFIYWDVEMPNDYLVQPALRTAGIEQIVTQRWLANIGNGYEGWIEWRRTGFPEFLAPLSSLNDGLIPVRFPYPADEQALNLDNYEAALSRIGGENSPNVEVWWDR